MFLRMVGVYGTRLQGTSVTTTFVIKRLFVIKFQSHAIPPLITKVVLINVHSDLESTPSITV